MRLKIGTQGRRLLCGIGRSHGAYAEAVIVGTERWVRERGVGEEMCCG